MLSWVFLFRVFSTSFHSVLGTGVIGAVPLRCFTLRRSRSIAVGGWLYKAIARYSIRRAFFCGVASAQIRLLFVIIVSTNQSQMLSRKCEDDLHKHLHNALV